MKEYLEIELEIVEIKNTDIIATSNPNGYDDEGREVE